MPTKNPTYTFTDFSEFEVDRGGPTPEWEFELVGDTLKVSVSEESYDAPDLPTTTTEALTILQRRLDQLQSEARGLVAFVKAAQKVTKLTTG